MNIVFNINRLGLEGLGATLVSLIRNCSNTKEIMLWFLCSELKKADKDNIQKLLQDENFWGLTKFVDFDAKKIFGQLRSLHGDWTTYGRLLIPDVIQSEKALYLDSDLIIKVDILELGKFTTDKVLSAVCGNTVQWSLESSFFIDKLKWRSDISYFNAGVLIFNILKWKEDDINKKVKKISSEYSDEFLSADQTLLNVVFEGNFAHLPEMFNLPWYPAASKPNQSNKAIIHFVGSPKPWDLFGKIIHTGYDEWNTYNNPSWKSEYSRITFDKIKRTWKIKKSLIKIIMQKLSNK